MFYDAMLVHCRKIILQLLEGWLCNHGWAKKEKFQDLFQALVSVSTFKMVFKTPFQLLMRFLIKTYEIHLKDIGNEIFYCPYLLGLPTEYLILYFCPSIPHLVSEKLKLASNFAFGRHLKNNGLC